MNIAFVGVNGLLVDGISAVAKKHDVVVYDEHEPSPSLPQEIKRVPLQKMFFGLEHLPVGERSLPFFMRGLTQSLKTQKPDTIIVMDFIRLWYWQVLWYCMRHPHTTLIVYAETQRVPRSFLSKIAFMLFLATYKLFEKYVSGYFVYTKYGEVFAHAHTISAPVYVMPVSVNTERFYPAVPHPETSSPIRILVNARFVDFKNHHDVFKAMTLLSEKERSHIHVSCIGRDGGNQTKIRNLVREYGLVEHVSFLETVSTETMRDVYIEHDVLLLASYNEPIGMVVPEAMACGLATITSDTVGANIYVQEGITGWLFPTGNSKELASILQQLANNKAAISLRGQAAINHIRANFTTEKRTTDFVKTIEGLSQRAVRGE